MILLDCWEHNREGSDWVDDIKVINTPPGVIDDIQGHPRERIGRAWRTRQDIRRYAAEHGLTESEALESGMQEKRKEFFEKGAELYAKM